MIIYKITNKINGKVYIGQTTMSLNRRWAAHCNKGTILFDAILKYGADNFLIEEIHQSNSIGELNELEPYYISLHNSLVPNGYNILPGGRNSLHTEETKIKMRKPKKNDGHTPESRKRSEATRKKVSDSKKGKKGHPLSEKHKQILLVCNLGRKHSQETKNKISSIHKGKKLSDKELEQRYNTLVDNGGTVRVLCVELDKVFNSLTEAAKFIGKNKNWAGNISRACKKNRKAYGYTWKFI